MKTDLLDTTTEEGCRQLDILTAKMLGYHVEKFHNYRSWHETGWDSYRLMQPDGTSEGDSYDGPETCWTDTPLFHRMAWTYELFINFVSRQPVLFSIGNNIFREDAHESIQKNNAFYCQIWKEDLRINANAPTVLIAILEAWNDFHEMTQEQEKQDD